MLSRTLFIINGLLELAAVRTNSSRPRLLSRARKMASHSEGKDDPFSPIQFCSVRQSVNQRMLAKQIGNARYAASLAVHGLDCLEAEDLFSRAASDAQALTDIALSFKPRQRARLSP